MPMMNMNSFTTRQQNHFGNFTYISNKNSNIMLSGASSPTADNQTIDTSSKDEKYSKNVSNRHFEDINEEEDDGDHAEMFVEIV